MVEMTDKHWRDVFDSERYLGLMQRRHDAVLESINNGNPQSEYIQTHIQLHELTLTKSHHFYCPYIPLTLTSAAPSGIIIPGA